MKLINKTHFQIEDKFCKFVDSQEPLKNLEIMIRYTPQNTKAPYSGICYYKKDKIRVSINPKNRYPVKIAVGSPFNKSSWEYYYLNSAEEVIEFVFLHEISHYLDYKNGIPVRCKQTKADKFALKKMGKIR